MLLRGGKREKEGIGDHAPSYPRTERFPSQEPTGPPAVTLPHSLTENSIDPLDYPDFSRDLLPSKKFLLTSETPLSVPQPGNALPYVQSMMKHGAIDSWVSRPSAVGKKWMSSTSVAETSCSTFLFFLKSQKIRNFPRNDMLLNSWHWRRLLNLQNYCCFAVFRGHCAKDIILFAVLLLLYHGTLRVRITLLSFFSSSAPTT